MVSVLQHRCRFLQKSTHRCTLSETGLPYVNEGVDKISEDLTSRFGVLSKGPIYGIADFEPLPWLLTEYAL